MTTCLSRRSIKPLFCECLNGCENGRTWEKQQPFIKNNNGGMNMSNKIIRFENTRNIDKTLYYQCREYVKLCLLIEELQCFKNEDGEYVYDELINQTLMKANLLLREFDISLQRIKNKLDGDVDD